MDRNKANQAEQQSVKVDELKVQNAFGDVKELQSQKSSARSKGKGIDDLSSQYREKNLKSYESDADSKQGAGGGRRPVKRKRTVIDLQQ